MWPTALKTLLELAPHITRLVPHAERYFSSKDGGGEAAAAEASNAKLLAQFDTMTEGLRADLTHATATNITLYRQLNDQAEKIAAASANALAAREAAEVVESRVALMEQRLYTNTKLLAATLLLNLGLVGLVIALLHRH